MELAEKLTLFFSGAFFLTGLITGVWKYLCIARSPEGVAPTYVDIAHRAALLYAFASLVILKFLEFSPYGETLNLVFALGPQIFFALAIFTYLVHGVLRDTDNQLRRPYRLGSYTLPGWMIYGFMWALIVAEVGGFAALFAGAMYTVFG